QERIFMFLDLDASTTLAERLGNIRFHELIDDYIYDITPAITSTGGEIYQYVGDEIVVTWKNGTLKSAINCIDCFFSVNHIMDSLAPKYIAKYGDAPAYKAGIHSGKVIVGVIGDIKKEIVFQGDVVNTASRIKEKCHSLGAKILVSHDLLAEIPKDELKYNAERVGSFLLKGKEHEVELYSITEA
ncbi:MAG TPA: adenylate/guanylate cyclase domain-containing protein, partial [Steroidobacteraceae bacterium]|nr:adenylate/guanylate cyclase domain-containing protein [Steroidobacteraceae bacterium]